MKQYSAVLSCKDVPYKTFVNGNMYSDDELTFQVKDVKIFVAFDGNLYIENFADYSDEQLSFLTLYKRNNNAFLTNYFFTCLIPITVVKKQTGEIIETFITVEMKHEGIHDNKVTYLFSLLNAKSLLAEIDYAIRELRNQLSDLYSIPICEFCKYGQVNPYGGDVYFNYLCFRKNKIGYLQFHTGVEKKDWNFLLIR